MGSVTLGPNDIILAASIASSDVPRSGQHMLGALVQASALPRAVPLSMSVLIVVHTAL